MISRRNARIAGAVLALGLALGTVAAQGPTRVPRAVLERYVGEYRYADGTSFKVGLDGDTLFQEIPGRRLAYTPISETLFMLGPVFTAEFAIDPAGGITQILSDGVAIEHRLRRKGSPPAPKLPLPAATVQVPRSVLEQYVGTYEFLPGQMSRTDLRVVVRLKGDTLIRVMGQEDVLTPISETQFKVGTTRLLVEFVVDDAGVTQVMGSGFQQLLARLKPRRSGSRPEQKPAATTASWSQWRGPNRDGSVLTALPDHWPGSLTKRWEIPVGAGHASPVVSGNRVIVFSRESDQEIVRALEVESGKEIWRAAYPAPYTVNPAAWTHGPGPKSTPAIAGGRVFTFGIGGVLSAFDLASGTLVWRVPAPSVLPEYGTATSPLIDSPNGVASVIVHVGGQANGALTSFDAATGKPRWQWTGDGPGSGSPIVATFAGVRQVIAQTQKFLVSLDAATGTLLWQLPFTTDFDQNAFTPVVFQDLLIFSGIDWPLTAIRPKLDGGQWSAEAVWTNSQASMFMSSPVVIGKTIYGLTTRSLGQFVAVDAASGKMLWSTKGREGENASMLGNAAWLLASTTDSNLVVARANPQKYEEVRRYRIADSAVWAHPAITDTSIIVKDVDKLTCWSFK